MLHIYIKRDLGYDSVLQEDNYRINPDLWFNYQGGADYISGKIEQEIIADIDKGKVISTNAIEFPIMGVLSPECLSGTSKALILANNEPNIYINGSFIGDNGFKWIVRLAELKEIYLRSNGIMNFDTDFMAHFVNDDSYTSTWSEFLDKAVDFL